MRNRSDPYRQNEAHPGAHTDRLRCRRTYTRESGFTRRSSNGQEPARPFRLRALAARLPRALKRPFRRSAFSAHSPAASRQPQPASALPCSSVSSLRFCSGRKQKAENSKRTEQLSSVRLRYTYQAAVSKLSTAVTLFTKSVSASLSINHSFSPYWISKSPRKSPGGQAAIREKLRLYNYLMEKNASMPGY